MNNFISDLYDYICECAPSLWNDPEYDRVIQAYTELEDEVKEKIGADLLSRYQSAEYELSRRHNMALLIQTLRLCHQFYLAVRP